MTFSQYAGTAIVPTLARLVLAAAFIKAGYNHVFDKEEFAPREAETLRQLNVNVEPVPPAGPPTVRRDNETDWQIVFVSHRQHTPGDFDPTSNMGDGYDGRGLKGLDRTLQREITGELTVQDFFDDREYPIGPLIFARHWQTEPMQPDASAAQPDEPEVLIPVQPPPDTSTPATTAAAQPGMALSMHRITILVHPKWPAYAIALAWIASLTELVGGALLLVGLFSRVWGLGLAIAMAVAFGLTSWETLCDVGLIEMSIPDFNRTFSQLALLVLAFGIFLTGPGPLSLDRLLFGRKTEVVIAETEAVKVET